jgi:hypothetical protein
MQYRCDSKPGSTRLSCPIRLESTTELKISLGTAGRLFAFAYKTTWLILNSIVPMAIITGFESKHYGTGSNNTRTPARHTSTRGRRIRLLASLTQSISLNLFRYDDARLPYVYMQHQKTNSAAMLVLSSPKQLLQTRPTCLVLGVHTNTTLSNRFRCLWVSTGTVSVMDVMILQAMPYS